MISPQIKKLVKMTQELHELALELETREEQADLILRTIQFYYPFNILHKTRKHKYTEARFAACYLYKKFTDLTLKEIAAKVKLHDHATVINAIKRAEELLSINDEKFCKEIGDLTGMVERALTIEKVNLKIA